MSQDLYIGVEQEELWAVVQGWGGYTATNTGEEIPFKEYDQVRLYHSKKNAQRYGGAGRIFKVTLNWEEVERD